ncbi:hypothetical protein CERSUDRAFT_152789 [Gelatoporia subvermispora B]|uniref:CENP-C homolog n=1 Tax=Ceriporiopsis subvermispora (strain B) TaxID=914234 RepID=M2QM61_CERS8|nr:hypothetical protein CERSUDRAFT_152789 [Gelatoporia subvermispora B]
MPASTRKSSIGVRRGPQKYIPYRADDLQHGKKTGIVVEYVDHKSDEFEPFEQVIGQADQRTPPRVQGARRKRIMKTPVVEADIYDEDGEMDMELEESERNPNSPSAYFANARISQITSSVQRVGSSSRPVPHSSDVDFDQVPSPRASPTSVAAQRSLTRGRSPGPSRLSKLFATQDADDDVHMGDGDDRMNDVSTGFNYEMDDDSDNEPVYSPPPEPQSQKKSVALSRRTSFAQMAQDDEEEDQVENAMSVDVSPVSRNKGKQRALEDDLPQDNFDHDFGQDMVEDELQPMAEEVQVEEQPKKRGRPPKKAKGRTQAQTDENAEQGEKPAKKPRAKSRKENVLREVITDFNQDDDDSGLRRGKRVRYAPLEWWRQERAVYAQREADNVVVPVIKEIRRIPREEPKPLGAKYRKAIKRRGRSKSKTVEVDPDGLVYNPEEGWDDDTVPDGECIDYDSQEVIRRRLAYTANMVNQRWALNEDFLFEKIFSDGDFVAAGMLTIPPGRQKPTKSTKDNTFVFYVVEGAVSCKVHKETFVIATGGMLMVPRGNIYWIQNISDRDAKLFFAQARKVVEGEDEDSPTVVRRSQSHARESGERLSAGPVPPRSMSREENPAALRRVTSTRA